MNTESEVGQRILLVEDSDVDYETVIRAFRKGNLSSQVFRCEDGDDALDYLHRRNRFAEPGAAPRPALVLLDLNLPGTDGREVLEEMKNDKNLKDIPVIVMTTSSDPRDVERCYKYGANSYVAKPVSFEGYIEAVRRLHSYWFETVMLPEPEHR
ncbi:MAG: Response regulator receiver domain-containing protein [Candidatus Electronema aureum]|uniref:Response regulator receiver domain-containing protein n=1 Tax=Candidatus Electronema aureum TaxID=2005002 RepID=A0A521FZG9_9BACT|nr:MAG: Response regulator receiver domain-containing protein [Candidatus Electronema aureum]